MQSETSMPDPSQVDPYKFAWDLKSPCSDCPFVKDTPLHDGIANDLATLAERSEEGNFVHSCHKTHPGADGWVPTYKGPVQNCAGLTIMALKNDDNITFPIIRAIAGKHLDPDTMDMTANTFDSIKDMARHYLKNHLQIRFLRRSRE